MDKKSGWKRFHKLKFDGKKMSRNARNAEIASTKHAHRFVLKKLSNLTQVRQNITAWLLIVTALIGAVIIQSAWYRSSYTSESPVSGGAYAEAMVGTIDTLNPLFATNEAEYSASKLLFSSLYDYDGTGHLRKDLATGMDLNAKKDTYTVTLRDDARWHDGKKVTAEDVVFTVGLMKNPETRSPLLRSWSGVTATIVDAQTVQFKLAGPLASFSDALTFSVLPRHILGDVEPTNIRENSFGISPVGSGPFSFRLLQTIQTERARKVAYLNANSNYYRGVPKLDSFEIHAYKNNSGLIEAARTRDVTSVVDINAEQAQKLPKAFESQSIALNSGVYALFNTSDGVLKDAKVRKALQLATDTDAVRKVTSPDSNPLNLPFVSTQIENRDLNVTKPALNQAKAKALLKQAGWRLNGDGVLAKKKVVLGLRVVLNQDADYRRAVKELERQWTDLGIKVTVLDFKASASGQGFAQSVLQPREYDVLVNELTIGADPDVFAYWHSSQADSSGLNFSNYSNPIADDALLSARLRSEQDLRDEKYKSFARQWLRDAPALGLYQSSARYASSTQSNSVRKSDATPSLKDRYSNILNWTAQNSQVYKTP